MMDKKILIRRHYESLYEDHVLKQYWAYLQDEELYEELLEENTLDGNDFRSDSALFKGLPQSVQDSYNYYCGQVSNRDLGWVGVSQVLYEGEMTFAVRVSTDGDDGWLEVYDHQGNEIGIGRTYIELIGWGDLKEIRDQVYQFDFPESLARKEEKTLWQFGSCVIQNDSPARFFVIAEKVPAEKQNEAVRVICDSTGISQKAVTAILDFLPHSITRNISLETAEEIWQKLSALGVETCIKEYRENHWVVIKTAAPERQ